MEKYPSLTINLASCFSLLAGTRTATPMESSLESTSWFRAFCLVGPAVIPMPGTSVPRLVFVFEQAFCIVLLAIYKWAGSTGKHGFKVDGQGRTGGRGPAGFETRDFVTL
ncbi:hypothetical protein CRV24_007877 [Beauveria bassiana]|nr:hypothetical protein CRV24_007877 [Beauveria bassiana]KAH8715919.1 hypothetical protein HC256_004711 [Beauveria bassiana]